MIAEFPLFIFTMLSGLAAGAYFICSFLPQRDERTKRPWLFPFVMLVVLGIGLLISTTHVLHPERVLNALSNPTSGITQEALWGSAACAVMFFDFLICFFSKGTPTRFAAMAEKVPRCLKSGTPKWLIVLGAFFAAGLMFVTSYTYASMFSTAAWRGPATFPQFFVADIAMGAAILPLFFKDLRKDGAYFTTCLALYVALAVVVAGIAVQFSLAGVFRALCVVGFVVSLGAIGVSLGIKRGSMITTSGAIVLVAVLVVAAAACIRYTFYAVY